MFKNCQKPIESGNVSYFLESYVKIEFAKIFMYSVFLYNYNTGAAYMYSIS